MQGRVPRGIERQTLSSQADFQGVFSGLRRGSYPNHRRGGFFIWDWHVPGGREGCSVRGKKGNSTEPVTGMAAEDYRGGGARGSLVIRGIPSLEKRETGATPCGAAGVGNFTCLPVGTGTPLPPDLLES